MAECGSTRKWAALVPVVFALFLGLGSIQGPALAQEAPPSDEEPAGEDPPSDDETSPPSDGGESPDRDSSGGGAPPSDGGEAPSDDSSSSNDKDSSSSGDEDSSATHTVAAASGGTAGEPTADELKKKIRKLVASTKDDSGRDKGEGKAVADADGDLSELVASGEGLKGAGGDTLSERIPTEAVEPSKARKASSALALTGATVLSGLGTGFAFIALGMVLLFWDRTKRLAIQIAACLPVF